MSNEIKKVNPINSKSPANNYYYNPYNQHSEYKQTDQQQSNMNGDYFEKSIEYPEYNYDSSGNFKETVTSDLKKKSRLKKNNNYNIIPERTENDVRGFIPGPPTYFDPDNYSQYLMQNPDNIYIKRLRGEEEKAPDIVTEQDIVDKYFEDDGFTLKEKYTRNNMNN